MDQNKQGTKCLYFASLIVNAAVFLMVAGAVISYFFMPGTGNMQVVGARCFVYFTIDSNILAAVACLLSIPYDVRSARSGKDEFPPFLRYFKFTGTAAVSVTFFTVMLFLGPTMGYDMMFVGNSFSLHLVCPFLCMIALPALEQRKKVAFAPALAGLAPVVVYGAVYMTMVVFIGAARGGWVDFYGFNVGGKWYLSFVVMLIATLLLSLGLRLWHNAFALDAVGKEEKK